MLGQRDRCSRTALHLAAKRGQVDVLKLLHDPMQVFGAETNVWRQMAIERAVKGPYRNERVESKSETYETNKQLPSFIRAHGVINFNRTEPVKWTIGSVEREKDERITLPIVAFLNWKLEKDKQHRSWFSSRDMDGYTALHHAAKNGHLKFIELLLEIKVIKVNIKDNKGKTAADVALEKCHFDIHGILQDACDYGE